MSSPHKYIATAEVLKYIQILRKVSQFTIQSIKNIEKVLFLKAKIKPFSPPKSYIGILEEVARPLICSIIKAVEVEIGNRLISKLGREFDKKAKIAKNEVLGCKNGFLGVKEDLQEPKKGLIQAEIEKEFFDLSKKLQKEIADLLCSDGSEPSSRSSKTAVNLKSRESETRPIWSILGGLQPRDQRTEDDVDEREYITNEFEEIMRINKGCRTYGIGEYPVGQITDSASTDQNLRNEELFEHLKKHPGLRAETMTDFYKQIGEKMVDLTALQKHLKQAPTSKNLIILAPESLLNESTTRSSTQFTTSSLYKKLKKVESSKIDFAPLKVSKPSSSSRMNSLTSRMLSDKENYEIFGFEKIEFEKLSEAQIQALEAAGSREGSSVDQNDNNTTIFMTFNDSETTIIQETINGTESDFELVVNAFGRKQGVRDVEREPSKPEMVSTIPKNPKNEFGGCLTISTNLHKNKRNEGHFEQNKQKKGRFEICSIINRDRLPKSGKKNDKSDSTALETENTRTGFVGGSGGSGGGLYGREISRFTLKENINLTDQNRRMVEKRGPRKQILATKDCNFGSERTELLLDSEELSRSSKGLNFSSKGWSEIGVNQRFNPANLGSGSTKTEGFQPKHGSFSRFKQNSITTARLENPKNVILLDFKKG